MRSKIDPQRKVPTTDKVSRIRRYFYAQKLKKENGCGKKKEWKSKKSQVEFLEIKKKSLKSGIQ